MKFSLSASGRRVLIALTALGVLFLFTGCQKLSDAVSKFRTDNVKGDSAAKSRKLPKKTLVIKTGEGDIELDVEVADEPDERALGYMFRGKISNDEGIWFVFDEEAMQRFWMRNVKFPLDLIFADENFTVNEILENIPPCDADPCPTYSSKEPARYALEIRGGLAKEKGVAAGDKISLQ